MTVVLRVLNILTILTIIETIEGLPFPPPIHVIKTLFRQHSTKKYIRYITGKLVECHAFHNKQNILTEYHFTYSRCIHEVFNSNLQNIVMHTNSVCITDLMVM